jgi:CMP-N-acetylneuraminic acid synthetase
VVRRPDAIAIVPARGGSKGVPGKNVREVGGKPLVSWSLEYGLAELGPDRVLLSSESLTILELGHRLHPGAILIGRPTYLATDEAPTDPVLLHALDFYERDHAAPRFVVLLQPTVPFRAPGMIGRCIDLMETGGFDSALTAVHARPHFVWHYDPETGTWRCNAEPLNARPRRQSLLPSQHRFIEDGAIYVTRTDVLRATRCRLGGRVVLVSHEVEGVDVDTEADLRRAEILLESQRKAEAP